MTQDELMNQLIINNEFDSLTPQDFADALGKYFLNIKVIIDRHNNQDAPEILSEKDYKLASYMFLDGWTPIFDYAEEFDIGEVTLLVLDDGAQFYCDFKVENDICYIKLKDKDKSGFTSRYLEPTGLDVAILVREKVNEKE